jgi:pyruvate/2-oxoglutarate dehydrogenase complex dihydrolipoamide dehydrogenase (E3) component
MDDRFDTIVIGAGPGGEVAINTLVGENQRLALIEAELIGGECTNWGCIPSKTLLRAPDVRGEADRAAGVERPELDWPRLSAYRDWMVSDHDDANRVARYEERGVTVLKERGRLAGPGRVEVGGRTIEADAVIVATGAEAVIPPIPGLQESGYWTNREATALTEIPASAVFVGGGVVAVELAQFLARFGSRVTIVQGAERLADREDAAIGELLQGALEREGVQVLLGRRAEAVRVEGGERVVELSDGTEARGEVVVVATGRRPRVADLGLETVGAAAAPQGILIDARCRAGERTWAVGDCTGGAFTHVAKYQARIAAADILGLEAAADYRAVPRVIFTDPEVAAVGLTEAQAREQGLRVAATTIDVATSIARPYTYEQDPTGSFGVVIDLDRDVLVGAWAVAPLASEWIHQAVLAIRAEVPVPVLTDTIAQFPSYSEAFGTALRALRPVGMRCDHCAVEALVAG